MADEVKKINVTQAQDSSMTPAQSGNPIAPQAGSTTLDSDAFADIRDQLVARYELLPDDLKALITDDEFRMKLFNLAKELKMTYEQLGVLEIEVTMVILGMTPPNQFRDELQIQLKKNDTEIDAIVAKVNEQIFTPIRVSLEKLYENHKEPEDYLDAPEGENSAPTAQVTNQTPSATPTPAVTTAKPVLTPDAKLTDTEKNVLGKAGVVLSENTGPKIAPQAPLSSRSNILAGIENPSTLKPNLVAEKLNTSAPVIPTAKTTDYSLPKTSTTVPSQPTTPKSDPYREPIN